MCPLISGNCIWRLVKKPYRMGLVQNKSSRGLKFVSNPARNSAKLTGSVPPGLKPTLVRLAFLRGLKPPPPSVTNSSVTFEVLPS